MTDQRPDAVALPPTGDGSRAARRSGRRRKEQALQAPRARKQRRVRKERRRPRLLSFLVVVLVIVVLAAIVLVALAKRAGEKVDDDDAGAPATGDRVTGLLLQRGEDGSLVGITLLVVAPSGEGGDILYVPPGTMVEAASLGLVPLRETAAQGDDVARAAFENLLGTRVDAVATLSSAALAEQVRPAGSLQVAVPDRVERRVGDRIETVFPAGPVTVAPDQVPDLLSLPARTDLERLVRHQAFWTAWLAALRRSPSDAEFGTALGPVGADIATLARGAVAHRVLPVKTISGGEDLYQVDQAALDALVPRLLPGIPTSSERITVQVLNGTGRPGVAQQLVVPLIEAGARVTLTGNADSFDYATTQIVYYDDENAGLAQRLRSALQIGEVVRSRAGIGAVEVTIVVGADFTAAATGTPSTSEGA